MIMTPKRGSKPSLTDSSNVDSIYTLSSARNTWSLFEGDRKDKDKRCLRNNVLSTVFGPKKVDVTEV
jgi:hypothetical protein